MVEKRLQVSRRGGKERGCATSASKHVVPKKSYEGNFLDSSIDQGENKKDTLGPDTRGGAAPTFPKGKARQSKRVWKGGHILDQRHPEKRAKGSRNEPGLGRRCLVG